MCDETNAPTQRTPMLERGESYNERVVRPERRTPVCANCEVDEALEGCDHCEQCLEDIPELRRPYIEARRLEAQEQQWKDERLGL